MFSGVPVLNLRGSRVVGSWVAAVVEAAVGDIKVEALVASWMVGGMMGVRSGGLVAKFASGVFEGDVVWVGWAGRIST